MSDIVQQDSAVLRGIANPIVKFDTKELNDEKQITKLQMQAISRLIETISYLKESPQQAIEDKAIIYPKI